jgi:hypothetical protein
VVALVAWSTGDPREWAKHALIYYNNIKALNAAARSTHDVV